MSEITLTLVDPQWDVLEPALMAMTEDPYRARLKSPEGDFVLNQVTSRIIPFEGVAHTLVFEGPE